jgi:hypothetical protein
VTLAFWFSGKVAMMPDSDSENQFCANHSKAISSAIAGLNPILRKL